MRTINDSELSMVEGGADICDAARTILSIGTANGQQVCDMLTYMLDLPQNSVACEIISGLIGNDNNTTTS
jgi:hypothetical protein